jgi:hypothetical protein
MIAESKLNADHYTPALSAVLIIQKRSGDRQMFKYVDALAKKGNVWECRSTNSARASGRTDGKDA